MKLVATALVAAAVLAGWASGARSAGVTFCRGSQLAGTFKLVPGSQGAGNVVYRLAVTNKSKTTCALTGLPVLKLYTKAGKAQKTHVIAEFRNGLTSVLVHLAPGKSAHANARFSPDVPGVGEGHPGQCEPTSYWLRVYSRGTFAKVAIKPPTPVCEHGQLQLAAYGPGR